MLLSRPAPQYTHTHQLVCATSSFVPRVQRGLPRTQRKTGRRRSTRGMHRHLRALADPVAVRLERQHRTALRSHNGHHLRRAALSSSDGGGQKAAAETRATRARPRGARRGRRCKAALCPRAVRRSRMRCTPPGVPCPLRVRARRRCARTQARGMPRTATARLRAPGGRDATAFHGRRAHAL